MPRYQNVKHYPGASAPLPADESSNNVGQARTRQNLEAFYGDNPQSETLRVFCALKDCIMALYADCERKKPLTACCRKKSQISYEHLTKIDNTKARETNLVSGRRLQKNVQEVCPAVMACRTCMLQGQITHCADSLANDQSQSTQTAEPRLTNQGKPERPTHRTNLERSTLYLQRNATIVTTETPRYVKYLEDVLARAPGNTRTINYALPPRRRYTTRV